jgi:hypothetical protein
MAGKHGHGFDIASRVARDREGDCTEYTVLLTALARSLDIPARIVMGLVVVREDAQFQAYGHAWAEFRIGDRWQVADAALSNLSTPFYYLPFGVLADEGPGFTFAIAHLTPVWVQRVIVLPASGGDGKSK